MKQEENKNSCLTLGIDDSGRGPVIGPMIMSGCLINSDMEKEFLTLGVKDSKKVLSNKRETLAPIIKEKAIDYEILVIYPDEIDSKTNAGINLNRIEAIKAAEIANLIEARNVVQDKIKLVVDCPSPNIEKWRNTLKSYINHPEKFEFIIEHKADVNHPACSAASIIGKSERERQVQLIKDKIGKDFGSLPYDEEVLVENNNKISIKKIGELSKILNKHIKVFSLSPKTFKISKFNVTNFLIHGKKEILELNLDYGKRVYLTDNHPVFCLDKKLSLSIKTITQIKPGDFIAVAGKINQSSNINSVNIIPYLHNFSNKMSPLYVSGAIINKLFNKKFQKIKKISKINSYNRTSIYQWHKPKKNFLPIHILSQLIGINKTNNLNEIYIAAREGPKFPAKLNISQELLWFIGIYIAEGSLTRDKVMISATHKEIIDKIIKFAKKLNINYYLTKSEVGLNSILLRKLISGMGLGNNAYIKRVPDFSFSLKSNNIKQLLQGIYDGDGYRDKDNCQEIETYSKELAKQIQWLELLNGNFTSVHKRKNRGGHVVRILSKSTNSLSPDNIPSIIKDYLKNLRIKNRLSLSFLSQKTGIAERVLWAIENNKVRNISKKTLYKLNRLYKDNNLLKLLNSDICWLRVNKISRTNRKEAVYDLEVKPHGKIIENFLGGEVGIILHNSGYPSDPVTCKFLKDYHKQHQKDGIFRETWQTWKQVCGKKEQKSLDSF